MQRLQPYSILCVCGLLLGFAWGQGMEGDGVNTPAQEIPVTTMENLRLPFEHFEDGRIKVQLMAGVAAIPAEGPVKASEVRLEFYSRDGQLEAVLSVDSCLFDRGEAMIRSTSRVRFARSGLMISGVGCELDAKQQTVRVLDQVRVVLSYDRNKIDFSSLGVFGAAKKSGETEGGQE